MDESLYCSGSELKRLLKTHPDQVLVVDVREEDFTRGNITGSLNLPFHTFPSSALSLLKSRLRESPPVGIIVVHCRFSQIRGPAAAEMIMGHDDFAGYQVKVLEGGWSGWFSAYKHDRDLTTLHADNTIA